MALNGELSNFSFYWLRVDRDIHSNLILKETCFETLAIPSGGLSTHRINVSAKKTEKLNGLCIRKSAINTLVYYLHISSVYPPPSNSHK